LSGSSGGDHVELLVGGAWSAPRTWRWGAHDAEDVLAEAERIIRSPR
jgi:hypothetical protein